MSRLDLAAHRAGIRTVILPVENKKDLEDIPGNVRRKLNFVTVSHMDDVLAQTLIRPGQEQVPPS